MLHLNVLGRIALTDVEGRPIGSVLHQGKRLALLTRLVLARGDFVRRDELLGLLWAESEEERARKALSQAAYSLRGSLGRDVVVRRGTDALGIARGSIACDALAFADAYDAGDLVDALSLYGGELMPGFFLDGCAAWQEWLDRERATLATRAAEAAWTLATDAEEAGDRVAAAKWARRGVEISPFDEAALRRLLDLLARVGDRAGALLEYERFAARLQEAFDDEPAAETAALAEEIRASGRAASTPSAAPDVRAARSTAEAPSGEAPGTAAIQAEGEGAETGGAAETVARISLESEAPARTTAAAAADASEEAFRAEAMDADVARARSTGAGAPAPPPRRAANRSRPQRPVRGRAAWRGAAAVVVAAAIIASALLLRNARKPPAEVQPGPVRVAVLPFEEIGTVEGLHDFAGALTLAVADHLARIRALKVVLSRDARVPGPGREAMDSAGRALGARMLVTGAVLGSGDRFRVRYALVDARTGTLVMVDTLDRPAGKLLPLVDEISTEVASGLRVALGREIRQERWYTTAPDTVVRQLLQAAEWQRARADTLSRVGSKPAAERALLAADSLVARAIARYPQWAEPWVVRGRLAEQLGWLYLLPPQSDTRRQRSYWGRGTRFADSAIAIDARNAGAWEIRGVLRYMLWATSVAERHPELGLLDGARQDLERATALDRTLPRSWSVLSAILASQGRFAEAREAAQQALSADAYLDDAQEIRYRLYTTSLDLGEDEDAARWCAEIRRRDEGDWTGAYCMLGLAAWSDVRPRGGAVDIWRTIGDVRENPAILRVVRPQLEMIAAAVLARRGERDSALAVIRRAKREGNGSSAVLLAEALARATLGEQAQAAALVAEYARYAPTAPLWVPRSRAFQRSKLAGARSKTSPRSSSPATGTAQN